MSGSIKRVYDSDKRDCNVKIPCDCVKDLGCAECEPLHPFSKRAILSCGQGSNAAFTNDNDPTTTVGSVIIDTSDIIKPTVGIQFSSVIQFLAIFTAASGQLTFQLTRTCDNRNPILLNTWVYALAGIEGNPGDFDALRFTKSFNFNFCDSPACSGCCEYSVTVSADNVAVATILVNNVQITALAQ